MTIDLDRLDFPAAMQAIGTANLVLRQFDWKQLGRLISDADGTLCFRDPTLFQQWMADPQRQAKIDIVRAAHRFTADIAKIIDQPPAEEASR